MRPIIRIVGVSSRPSTSIQTTGHFSRAADSSSGRRIVVSSVVVPSHAIIRSVAGTVSTAAVAMAPTTGWLRSGRR